MSHLNFVFVSVGIALGLFVAMLLCLELGRRIGIGALAKEGEASRVGVGKVDTAVYSLFALLMGFAFSGAAGRYLSRQEHIVQEVAGIRTAWQRIPSLPPEAQAPVRTVFIRYVDALVAACAEAPGSAAEARYRVAAGKARDEMWSIALAASIVPSGERARMFLLPSLNEMFEQGEKEHLARQLHPPTVIFVMLGLLALASALFAGFAMASSPKRNWMYIGGVAAAIAMVSYVVIEIEFPHRGLIRVDPADQTLVDLRAELH